MRAVAIVLGLTCILSGILAPAAGAAEPTADEQSPGDLFAFGVRGLPSSYATYEGGRARHKAIQRGLEWLAVHQKPDGSWNPAELQWCNGKVDKNSEEPIDGVGKDLYTVGVTGIALSAFMGAGYTYEGKHRYARVVHKGLTWLSKMQDAQGCFGPRRIQQYVYNHAFAALAMVEAYGLTGNAKVGASAQRALDFGALMRNPKSAWRYGIKPQDNDTSVTGCVCMAFYMAMRLNHAAERAGWMAPLRLDESMFEGVRIWIDSMTDATYGRVGYVSRGTGPARPQEYVGTYPAENSEALTAIAVFLRHVLPGWNEKTNAKHIRNGLSLIGALTPRWEKGHVDLYYWYYGSLACVHAGGATWKAWDAALVTALVGAQRTDGDVCQALGSWDAASVWGKADGGRIFDTAFAVLCLETPDRIRPLDKQRTDLQTAWDAETLDPALRPRLVRAFAHYRVPGAGERLAKALAASDPALRAAAAAMLRRPGIEIDRGTVLALGRALADADVGVRAEAARTLATQGTRVLPVLPALTKALDDDPRVAWSAAAAVGGAGDPAALEKLKQMLAAKAELVRVAAAGAVWHLAKDAPLVEPVLWQALASHEALVRAEAARHLDAMGPAAERSADVLMKALRDDDARVRVHAAGALWQQKRALKTVVDVLSAGLLKGDEAVKILACERLEAAGRDAAPATPTLAAQLLGGSVSLRVAAARGLGAIGPGARGGLAALWYAAGGRSEALREACVTALAALGLSSGDTVAALMPLFESKDPRLVEGAVRGLAAQGAQAVPALVQRLRACQSSAQVQLLAALGGMGAGAEGAVPAIAEVMTKAKNYAVRVEAAKALARIGPAAAPGLEALTARLDDSSPSVRQAAVQAIAAIALKNDEALQLLITVLGTTGKKRTPARIEAARALGDFKRRARPALPALLKVLRDKDDDLRRAAAKALAALSPMSLSDLRKTLTQFSGRARAGAAMALGFIGPPAKKAVSDLVGLVAKEGFGPGEVFGNALVSIGKPSVSPLKKLLAHRKVWVRTTAATLLGRIGPEAKSAVGKLKKLLKDADQNVRGAAARALEAIQRK